MRLKPALVMLGVFVIVIAALAVFVSTYEAPGTDELMTFAAARLFPGLAPGDVAKVEVVSPKIGKAPVVIGRAGQRKWRMSRPVAALASHKKVNKLLTDFTRLQAARGYTAKNLADYELDEPKFRVTVTDRAGKSFTLSFGVELPPVARAAHEKRVDPYTLEERGGTEEILRQRYARVGEQDQVLIVEDNICPEIDIDPAAFREPALVYTETADDILPVGPRDIRGLSITVQEDGKARSVSLAASEDGKWRLKTPVDARADNQKLRLAIEETLALRARDADAYVDDDPKDLAQYGLDKPSVVVELEAPADGDRAVKHTIRFGSSPADKGGLVFAQSDSRNAVLLVAKGVVEEHLKETAAGFRDRRVAVFAMSAVQSVTFTYAGDRPKLTIARRPDDSTKWLLKQPVSGRANAALAVNPIRWLGTLTVEPDGFVSEDPADLAGYGLDKPSVTASVALKGQPAVEVFIGASPKGKDHLVYAKNAAEPSVVLVSKAIIDDLSPDVAELRSATLLEGFDRWGAFELGLVRGEKTVKLERGDRPAWSFVSPKGLAVDYTAPSDFLADLADLVIRAWPADKPEDYAPFGLDKPCAVVTVKTRREELGEFGAGASEDEAEKTFVVHFGAKTKDGKRCYVRLPSETNVYEVEAEILGTIDKGALAFRDRQVLDFDPSSVRSLRVEGGRATYFVQRAPGGNWLLSEPIPVLGDVANITALLEMLDGLAAREFVCEGDLDKPAYGLAKPFRKVALSVEQKKTGPARPAEGERPKEPERTLLVGAPVPDDKEGGRYAAIGEDKLVFVMSADDIKKLDPELATSTVLNVVKANVAGVTVTHRDGSGVEVARKDGAWEVTSHKDVTPDIDAIEQLVEEAGWVTAERYVAYNQKGLNDYGLDKPLLIVAVRQKGKVAGELRIGDEAEGLPREDERAGEKKKMYYATGGGIPAVFLVAEGKVKALDKHIEDLIKK